MHANRIRKSIGQLRDDLKNKQAELDRVVKNCRHEWGETKYEPLYQKAHTIKGDYDHRGRPTLGVDSRPDFHVPSKTTPRWTRTCEKCGHTEETYNKKSVGASSGLSKEAPDFGDRGHRPFDMLGA
jgi:hypothetical protein